MTVLSWFDQNPALHWWLACILTGVILWVVFRPLLKRDWSNPQGSDGWWSLAILSLLFWGRWPSILYTRQFSEDESQMIAGAITLHHDPIFWRSVDGCTAGPLDFYVLWPAGWLCGGDTLLSARITAVLLLFVALFFTHQTLSIIFGRQVARISTFSAAFFEAFTLDGELLHYSTELLSIALLAFVFWSGVKRFTEKRSVRWDIAAGLALGLVPLAKLQAAPIGFLLGLLWVAFELKSGDLTGHQKFHRIVTLCLSALIPTVLLSAVVIAAGQGRDAFISYILSNIAYAKGHTGTLTYVSLRLFRDASLNGALLATWTTACGFWLVLTLPLSRTASKIQSTVAFASLGFFFVSLLCILAPHRAFLHYSQLIVMPGTLFLGCATALVVQGPYKWAGFSRILACSALLVTSGAIILDRAGFDHPNLGTLVDFRKNPKGAVTLELAKYARPGEPLAIWGWMPRCYAETGFRQATRSAIGLNEIVSGPYQGYFLQRYLEDFDRSSPPLFVDAVGKSHFGFDDRVVAHDQFFPALATRIHDNYTFVAEIQYTRIYVRNDRLAQTFPGLDNPAVSTPAN